LGWGIVADSTRCIAIVGAGFCGTVTAIKLLQQAHGEPLRILLIDRERHGRGTAYADHSSYSYLLNVPAGRMSAFSSEPLDFLRYAQRALPNVTADDFLPRILYGQYLEEKLSLAERAASSHVSLERVRGTVRSVQVWRPSHTFILGFEDGHEMTATEVVLALGNPPPAALPGTDQMREASHLVADNPWCDSGTSSHDGTVLMVGTGLTMADIVASTVQIGHRPARMYAISRHGLVPPRQTAFRHSHSEFDPQPLLRAASVSMRQLVHLVRQISRDTERRGGDWREAVTFVRSVAPKLWARLPDSERKRFLRHVRAYWDIHRHRLPPSTRAAVDELRTAHRLIIRAGKILQLEPTGNQVRVIWRPRGQEESAVLVVDRVINCTGPDYRCTASRDPLVRDLIANGLIQPDALGIGLRTAPNGGLVNLFGRATRGLYYIGPMLRADHWEATAVQELREYAENLAHELARPEVSRALAQSAS
jgi:uncharacterized NAD(P)/FAD-binding protein YdhS